MDKFENIKKHKKFEDRVLPFLTEIHSAAHRLARNNKTVEEVTAMVFKEAWDCFDQLSPETNIRVWLYCIFAGICLAGDWSHLQLRPMVPPSGAEFEDKSFFYHKLFSRCVHLGDENVRNILANLKENEIYRALDQLPGHIRLIVVLGDFQRISINEIGQILGIPPEKVGLWLRRGRFLLQGALWSELADLVYTHGCSQEYSMMN